MVFDDAAGHGDLLCGSSPLGTLVRAAAGLIVSEAAGLALASYHVYRAPLALATINYDRPL